MSRETSSFTANVEGVSVENSAEIGCGLRSDVTDRGMRPGSKKLNSIILLYEKKEPSKTALIREFPVELHIEQIKKISFI
ncbi:hypothetical protein AVEN_31422-1 [Araneus ventricosus]|uniref:Uncharacterized protein n=2 Tax=Araneus ventricosus TaxID=182803 RepID=A0A4Y2H6M1_ARAVE|nr:hypothetical protein AVEN_31422-1 [Araneus ventricosus]